MKILLGSDPEIFVKKDGKNVSADTFAKGTKENPYPLKYGAMQLDGTALEFNTQPAASGSEFAHNVQAVLDELRVLTPAEYTFDFSPAVFYETAIWDAIPNSSKELGCNPDYNAWYSKMNKVPTLSGKHKFMRTGSGHLHVGWGTHLPLSVSHVWDCERVVKCLDRYFGAFKRKWDKDTDRSNLYGGEGAYRPKPYGVEYRVLSNAWLNHPKIWPWIFDSVQYVMNKIEAGEEDRTILSIWNSEYFKTYCPDAPKFDAAWLKAA